MQITLPYFLLPYIATLFVDFISAFICNPSQLRHNRQSYYKRQPIFLVFTFLDRFEIYPEQIGQCRCIKFNTMTKLLNY